MVGNQMKPITIITGFLGSGKTTLLNQLLNQNHGRKIAVIENEFGEKNIDYEFVLHEKEKIFQMTNGCICCNVREDLVKTLKEISSFQDKFDSVVIETTGLADPSPVLHTLKQDPEVQAGYFIDSILTLVDAKNFFIQWDRSPEVKKQVMAANIIILNKIDLVTDDECEKIQKFLISVNPDTELIKSKHGQLNFDKIFLRKLFQFKSEDNFLFKKINLANSIHQSEISSKLFEFKGSLNPQFFGLWIDLLFYQCSEDLYRMKGILHFENEPNKVFFQCIHDYIELTLGEPWGEVERINQIVAIGKSLDFNLIETGFKNCISK